MHFLVRPVAGLTDVERAEVRALALAVYPPETVAGWPGRAVEWAPADWCVLGRDTGHVLRSYAGLLIRDATLNGRPVRVGGVGGVKTHPDARGRGFAAAAVARGVDFFHEQGADFALLVCESELMPYYRRLGWAEFDGTPLVTQRGEPVAFTFNRAMTHGVGSAAPAGGRLDLCGPPW